ncbi:Hypothetical protein SMAX5B_011256 [Scophthalmus maximus]|uniref:Uncharacterized protein n=1 Tax=Scophthalmus maximus TaxID=52904 RepID=A0A2U9BI88_SCOMX|nr:Hypothetical protein SMAX5B_011256 [Scophthalmus maximus]
MEFANCSSYRSPSQGAGGESAAGRLHVDQPDATDLPQVVVTTVDDEEVSCCSSSRSGNKVEEDFSTPVHQPNTARQGLQLSGHLDGQTHHHVHIVTVGLKLINYITVKSSNYDWYWFVLCNDWYRSARYRSQYRPGAASGLRLAGSHLALIVALFNIFSHVIYRLILDVNGRPDYSQYERPFSTSGYVQIISSMNVCSQLVLAGSGRSDHGLDGWTGNQPVFTGNYDATYSGPYLQHNAVFYYTLEFRPRKSGW